MVPIDIVSGVNSKMLEKSLEEVGMHFVHDKNFVQNIINWVDHEKDFAPLRQILQIWFQSLAFWWRLVHLLELGHQIVNQFLVHDFFAVFLPYKEISFHAWNSQIETRANLNEEPLDIRHRDFTFDHQLHIGCGFCRELRQLAFVCSWNWLVQRMVVIAGIHLQSVDRVVGSLFWDSRVRFTITTCRSGHHFGRFRLHAMPWAPRFRYWQHNTQHTTHNTQHTTHNTQHTTHNTQHTTHNTKFCLQYLFPCHYIVFRSVGTKSRGNSNLPTKNRVRP